MNQIPSMWRTELWHPMLVHFPIATLLLASIAGVLCIFIKAGIQKTFLKQFLTLMLIIGVITGWIAIYTGLQSYNIEVRKLCDPKVLQEHDWWGYASVIVYSIALFFQILAIWLNKSRDRLWSAIVVILLIAGAAGLLYCGHLGAKVVYQQGGGTYKPSANCTEFEK